LGTLHLFGRNGKGRRTRHDLDIGSGSLSRLWGISHRFVRSFSLFLLQGSLLCVDFRTSGARASYGMHRLWATGSLIFLSIRRRIWILRALMMSGQESRAAAKRGGRARVPSTTACGEDRREEREPDVAAVAEVREEAAAEAEAGGAGRRDRRPRSSRPDSSRMSANRTSSAGGRSLTRCPTSTPASISRIGARLARSMRSSERSSATRTSP
jgi:hypothetical protein